MRSPTRVLITFCVGVAATLAWQSYGDAARQIVAKSDPRLGWLAPQAAPIPHRPSDGMALVAPATPALEQRLNSISNDVDAVRQNLDAVRQNIDRIAATQEQIMRGLDRMTTGQVEKQSLQKN
jgi:hypothetical protein